MANSTPGPWKVDADAAENAVDVYADHGQRENPVICGLIEDEHGERTEIEANAALIAAAPDMAKALQYLLTPGWDATVAVAKARAAIAKAERRAL